MPTIQEFIDKAGLSMTFNRVDKNPFMEDDASNPMFHFSCTIRRSGRDPFVVEFSKGSGHVVKGKQYGGGYRTKDEPIPPSLDEVLDCLSSDARGYEDAPLFEDWASEYGYDTDSRKAERTFRAVQEQAARLQKLLGPDLYNELLYETESF